MAGGSVATRITLYACSRVAGPDCPDADTLGGREDGTDAASVLLPWDSPPRMDVRDAVESDAEALADIADAPTDVMRNVIHDRTVRVAAAAGSGVDGESGSEGDDAGDGVDADGGADANGGADADDSAGTGAVEPGNVTGFVSFDARDDAVHITQFGGDSGSYGPLLAEPARFARKEGMRVEVIVDAGDETRRSALESAGFEYDGTGPTFEGQETVRYGLAP